MKSKLLLLCYFLLTLSFVVSANETQIIPLTVVVDGSNDGPSQDGKDPTTPNQFIATINNHIFSVKTTLNEIVYLEIFNTKGEKIINTDFRDKFTCELEDNGNYKLQLRYQDIELEGYFDITLSQDEAASIVMKMFEDEDVDIYVFNEIYTTGDTIRLVRPSPSQDIIVNESSWVAFVDLHPFENWSHPCEYILINAYTGIPTTYARTDFPKETEWILYDIPDKYKTAQVSTVDDAFLIVDSMYKGEKVDIYMYATCFNGNKTIELISPINDNVELAYPYSGHRYWVAFVDLHPMANWSHPCEYVFIDILTGHVITITKNMPPIQLGELFLYMADNTNTTFLQSTNDNSNKQSNLTIDEDVSYVIDPAQTTINILSSSKIQQVNIYNRHGFLLLSTGEPTIDISSFPLGVYIVQIQMDTQSVQTKFIKQ